VKRAAAFLLILAFGVCAPAGAAVAASAPTIEYTTPSPIRNHEATLRFAIDPNGLETMWEVEYARVGEEFHDWEMPTAIPAGDELVAIEFKIPRYWEGSLLAGTEYHWRVRAWNAEGEVTGPEQFFGTTNGPRPAVANGAATQTGEGTVEFTATIDPEGVLLTGCRFRYLDAITYDQVGFDHHAASEPIRVGPTVPCAESLEEIGSGTDPVTVHAVVSGLEPGDYYFRIEAENGYEDSALLAGTPFAVSVVPPPASGPPVPPGVNPLGLGKAPGLAKAPGLRKAPGLQRARKKSARQRQLRRNATIVAPR
jgi:hypothetical protein